MFAEVASGTLQQNSSVVARCSIPSSIQTHNTESSVTVEVSSVTTGLSVAEHVREKISPAVLEPDWVMFTFSLPKFTVKTIN